MLKYKVNNSEKKKNLNENKLVNNNSCLQCKRNFS